MDTCTAIVGINWGDEGKGRMVDLLTENFDIVVRYQGGGNAGHTILNQYGEFLRKYVDLPGRIAAAGESVGCNAVLAFGWGKEGMDNG